jgi:hypothetical protein
MHIQIFINNNNNKNKRTLEIRENVSGIHV